MRESVMEMEAEKERQLRLLTGVDGLGRTFGPAGPARAGKRVGMFFWLWIGQPLATGAYDAEAILAAPGGVDTLFYHDTPASPDGQPHFWGRPLWGYYNSADEWVIRRQLELLTLAGVDFLVFDATNALTYSAVYTQVLAAIERLQADGWQPPRAAFYTHSYSMRTATALYHELYQPGHYANTWYLEEGRPLLIAYTDPEDDRQWARREMKDDGYDPPPYPEEIRSFFRFRKPQWPLDPNYPDGFPWVEWTFPQPLHTDVMSVSVASHPNVPFSFTLTRGLENWGRGWDVVERRNRPGCIDAGVFFQSQWDHALSVDPGTVFVGGWNEWIAYKQLWDGEYMLCDAANREFSRDIEPMAGGHQDAFYLQLIANIRRYKFSPAEDPLPGRPITYHAILPVGPGRGAPGVCPDLRYVAPAPPNSIASVTVSSRCDSIEFDVAFHKPVSGGDVLAFQLLIGCGEVNRRGFEGYGWRVGPLPERQGLFLQGFGDNSPEPLPVEHGIRENRLVFRMMHLDLGEESGSSIYFKAAAYIDNPGDIMSYYTSGSALPSGRLSYGYPLGNGSEGIE